MPTRSASVDGVASPPAATLACDPMGSSSDNHPTAGLALIRMAVGGILLRTGWLALSDGGVTGPQIRATVEGALSDLPSLARWWGASVVLENPDAIAFLWRWLTLATGLGLLFGALTRPLGLIATLLMANAYLFGSPDLQLLHFLMALCCLACAISRAGRTLGLDAALEPAFPSWLTWVRSNKRKW